MKSSLLSLAIWLPIAAGALVLLSGDRRRATKWVALFGAILGFLVTLPLYAQFDTGTSVPITLHEVRVR